MTHLLYFWPYLIDAICVTHPPSGYPRNRRPECRGNETRDTVSRHNGLRETAIVDHGTLLSPFDIVLRVYSRVLENEAA